MRRAWRVSLAKIDVHNGASKTRGGTIGLPIAILVALLLIALYPVPGWFGYDLPKAAASPQIFIDRITHPYFQFFAVVILITMGLGDRVIALLQAEGRLQAVHHRPQAQGCSWIFCGHLPRRRLCACQPLCFQHPRQFRQLLQAGAEAGHARGLRSGRHEAVHAGRRRQLSRHLRFGGLPRRPPNRIRHRQSLHAGRGDARAARTLSVRDQKRDGDWSISRRTFGPGGMPLRAFLPIGRTTAVLDQAVALATIALCWRWPIRSSGRSIGRLDASSLRYGETGNDGEFHRRRDRRTVALTRNSGRPATDELFVYLNRPVSGVLPGLFRNVNTGKARIWIFVFRR